MSSYIPPGARPKLARTTSNKWVVTLSGTVITAPGSYGSAKATRKRLYGLLLRLGLFSPPSLSQFLAALNNFVRLAADPASGFVPTWTTGA